MGLYVGDVLVKEGERRGMERRGIKKEGEDGN